MDKRFTFTALLAACVLLATAVDAQDVIRSGTVIGNTLGTAQGPGPDSLFFQDSLFALNDPSVQDDPNEQPVSYVSGLTLFDLFDPTSVESRSVTNSWFSSFPGIGPPAPGFTDFDLGVSTTVTRLAFWDVPLTDSFATDGHNTNSTGDFTVFVSDDPTFAGAVDVGNFTLVNNGLSSGAPGQIFDLSDTLGRYVRIEHLTTQGGPQFGAGALAFATTDTPVPEAIPEPGTVALFGLAGLVIGLRRKKRIARQL